MWEACTLEDDVGERDGAWGMQGLDPVYAPDWAGPLLCHQHVGPSCGAGHERHEGPQGSRWV